MNAVFRPVFYLRSNYVNKEGKTPVMLRVYLNNERISLGSTGISVDKRLWDKEGELLKGRSLEVVNLNAQLGNIKTSLNNIFLRLEVANEDITLERIKAIYLGKENKQTTILEVYDKYLENVRRQVGVSLGEISLFRYQTVRRYFAEFLSVKYSRSDLSLKELTPNVIYDFELFLLFDKKNARNTTSKKLKTLKTITIYAQKCGDLMHDPFLNFKFQSETVDRGFLTDDEVFRIANKEFSIERLDFVRDMFLFSCFTGLAYIDVVNLTPDNIVVLDDKEWIMTKRQKTKIESNILLLDIPKMIISKYSHQTYKNGKLFPVLSNQKMNSYLKEIADVCGIKKKLTYHLARHTFATMSLSKGVPMESVSKMLGHTNIKTTQIYARITNKKVEQDMEQLAQKLGKFDSVMTRQQNL